MSISINNNIIYNPTASEIRLLPGFPRTTMRANHCSQFFEVCHAKTEVTIDKTKF